jgi:hypothetical protein
MARKAGGMTHRYTRETKNQLVTLIDWLGSNGYAAATRAIMKKLRLSPKELKEWRRTA